MAGLLRTIKISLVVGLNHRSQDRFEDDRKILTVSDIQDDNLAAWQLLRPTSSDQAIEMQQEVVEALNAKCLYMWINMYLHPQQNWHA